VAEGGEEAESGHAPEAATELSLMAVSIAVAGAGIGLAAVFFLRRRDLAEAAASRWRGLYRLLLHKYYVDEIYDAGVVQPVKTLSEQVLWEGVDVGIIDGAVNGAGLTVRGASGALRLLQSGSLRTYAASLFLGVLLILGYALWPR
jgi:NADH-quinone oxidoreductase subunit L